MIGSHRAKVAGISEMLVRCRLSMVSELREEYGLDITLRLVRSKENKADILTRVSQAWLRSKQPSEVLTKLHKQHHFGVRRSLYFSQQLDPSVSYADVEAVVRACPDCASVDPAPIQWENGEIGVTDNWQRLATDVTHYGRERFLTIIDCGPSRFAIWRRIISEDATVVVAVFEQVFHERGPPAELLMDNGATFKSAAMGDLCKRWGVRQRFRCAYRPSGNGIIERNHRTIKSLAARTGKSPLDMLFWYNSAPLENNIVPSEAVYTYQWRNPMLLNNIDDENILDSTYTVGDAVFVKPAQARCTTRWPTGIVTALPSPTCVEVNGTPRHVADCRPVPLDAKPAGELGGDGRTDEVDIEPDPPELRRSTRDRRAPFRFPDVDPAVLLD